ncbi:putative membrane protein [Staphylococcus aureus subsp. aureus CIGC340D]|nr:membrane protein [Staphylococcus aureus]EHT44106.1 putative membrane protein [Staphylococcus aureus subsp. aureus CIG1835]EHT47432.1 putative membrane protein [Staphylococcus aureus subsp. aureus CIG1096]EHT49652.1 putative membrane protein [Staphylococcus aureus subsp. aureus CIG1150]EHT55947.1 putative membrane protein [Staphylococcus aureus subsp. aureus CIG1213]EHT66558.1 putative membrane protein [Staphylococcus aureus subsp. aureus CIG1770]EHT81812.1 putative membrane protein [Staphy
MLYNKYVIIVHIIIVSMKRLVAVFLTLFLKVNGTAKAL